MTNQKPYHILLITLFVTLLIIPVVGIRFTAQQDISENEKRELAKFPDFSFDYDVIEAFPKKFEAYLNDHFFLRERFVNLHNSMLVKGFHSSPNEFTLIGSDDWLFSLFDGIYEDESGRKTLKEHEVNIWKDIIIQRSQILKSWSGQYLHVVAPNKISVYPEYLPSRFEKLGVSRREQFAAVAKSSAEITPYYLDLHDAVMAAKSDRLVYHKTDTHWTTYGAFNGYIAIMDKLKETNPDLVAYTKEDLEFTIRPKVSGDLVKFIGASQTFNEDVIFTTLKSSCTLKEEMPITVNINGKEDTIYEGGCATSLNNKKVFVISDSFLEAMRPFLYHSFTHVIMDRNVPFNKILEYIEAYQPDYVIRISVARYLPKSLRFIKDRPIK